MEKSEGYIKLFRCVNQWEWFKYPHMFRLFNHLILAANHYERRWEGTVIKRGQLITSPQKISDATGIKSSTVRRHLKKLESTGEISIKTTNKFTIITICNYDNFQSWEGGNRQATNKQKANKRQAISNKQKVEEFKNTTTTGLPDKVLVSDKTNTPDDIVVDFSSEFKEIELTHGIIKEVNKKYTADHIENCLEHTAEKAKDNPAGYFLEIIKNPNIGPSKKRKQDANNVLSMKAEREKRTKLKKKKNSMLYLIMPTKTCRSRY